MKQPLTIDNRLDHHGAPAGGYAEGCGLAIRWQNGPLGRGDSRKEPNGAFVETVIHAALLRLEHYQETRFRCDENAGAIADLRHALGWLQMRTREREAVGVEGTHGTRVGIEGVIR